MTAPMLQVDKLSAWYGAARILYDLDLTVGRGEVLNRQHGIAHARAPCLANVLPAPK